MCSIEYQFSWWSLIWYCAFPKWTDFFQCLYWNFTPNRLWLWLSSVRWDGAQCDPTPLGQGWRQTLCPDHEASPGVDIRHSEAPQLGGLGLWIQAAWPACSGCHQCISSSSKFLMWIINGELYHAVDTGFYIYLQILLLLLYLAKGPNISSTFPLFPTGWQMWCFVFLLIRISLPMFGLVNLPTPHPITGRNNNQDVIFFYWSS